MTLPKYCIPRDLMIAVDAIETPTLVGSIILRQNKFLRILKKLKNVNNRSVDIAECHYLQLLKLGLYLEEYQQGKVVNEFKIYGATIERVQHSNRQFKILINNVNASQPVLNISDSLLAYEETNQDTGFFLKVLRVSRDHVTVNATEKFCKAYSDSAKYNVELNFNNYSFQCCHDALTAIHNTPSTVSDYFFPKKTAESYSKQLNLCPTWFNVDVSNNPEQKEAVFNIINKSAHPAPYILYGPPGTGKTSTLIEAVCQISKQHSSDYILICAQSNTACDLITKSLLEYIGMENAPLYMFRIYSQLQEYYNIDEDIKKISNYNDRSYSGDLRKTDFFSKKIIPRIIITTLCTSWRLVECNLPFSHVFIDEAGQVNQAEALLPLCLLKSSSSCQLVMIGDHQLLGPCIRSNLAEPLLGQSILEKLMKHEPYQKNDTRYITRLFRNFRSSKDIIHVPNRLFYDNKIIASIKQTKSTALPVIAFYAVEGKEEKIGNSNSSYNENEINVIVYFVESFLGKKVGDKIIGRKDIGIISPFTLQTAKIRQKLNDIGLREIDVGNVETYQGQEKEIIIITTVRSRRFNQNSVDHTGFFSNPKRFNVAITRAKTTLMVVGNPYVLQTSKYWRDFLKFCQEKNVCYGDSFVINNEVDLYRFFSMERFISNRSKSIKSTDLFDTTFTILGLDKNTLDENIVDTNYYYRCSSYYSKLIIHENNKLLTFVIVHLILYVFNFLLCFGEND